MRCIRRLTWASAALLCASTASAQGLPDPASDPAIPGEQPSEAGADEPAEALLVEALPASFREGWAWVSVGPRTRDRMSDVAVHPTRRDVLAAVSAAGEVWVSVDRGLRWDRVLVGPRADFGGSSSNEDIILGVEARVDELVGGISSEDFTVDPDDFLDDPEGLEAAIEEMADLAADLAQQAADATADAVDQVRGEVADGGGFFAAPSEQESARVAGPRVWFGDAGELLVGRSDGLHLSRDLGGAWSRVLDVAVHALTKLPERNLWVAGTSDGIRFAVDLSIWIDPEDGTEGIFIADVRADGDGVFAATESGLWYAADGQSWVAMGTARESMNALLVDPTWDGGLWVASDRSVLRSDDGGNSLSEGLAAPLAAVRDLAFIGAGHLLAVSADGPWETVDGGTTWSPISLGLSHPSTVGLDVRGLDVVVASAEGIYRLERIPEGGLPTVGAGPLAAPEDDWIAIDALMGTAVSRPELTATMGSRLAAAALPQLTIYASYRDEDALDYLVASGSERQLGGLFEAGVQLKWTGSRPARTDFNPVTVGGNAEVVTNLSAGVMGDAMRRSATTYGISVADDVAEMYFARKQLISEQSLLATASLRDKVDHELKIRELEAQLDHITNGAVSAWRTQ